MEHMAENTIWIQEQGFDCLNAFQWATEWNVEKTYPVLKKELKKLVEYYSDHPEKHVCLLLNYNFPKFDTPVTDSYRYCVDIDDPVECYDAKGVYAPCHGFTEFTVGDKKIADEFAKLSIKDLKLEPENPCYGCQLINLCRICFAANHMLTGDIQKQNLEICLFNQECILAGIEIELNRAERYLDRKLSDADRERLSRVREYIKSKNMLS
jgi:radical SAM protein with 4Fe4S-binding SPASM domain